MTAITAEYSQLGLPFGDCAIVPASAVRPFEVNAMRRNHVLGAVGVLAGCLVAVLVLRGIIFCMITDIWTAIHYVLIAATAVFLVYVGMRGIRYGQSPKPSPKLRWGRLLLGVWLIFLPARSHFQPATMLFPPSNEGEAEGMIAADLVVSIAGVVLIVWGAPHRPIHHVLK